MRVPNRRLLVLLGLCLFAIAVLALVAAFQRSSDSEETGAVSDIALFADRRMVVYSQEASADESRFLPCCNPPNVHYLKAQPFDPGAPGYGEPKVYLTYWHLWPDHAFPEYQTSAPTSSVVLFAGMPAGGDDAFDAGGAPPYNGPLRPLLNGAHLRRGFDYLGFERQSLFCFDVDRMRCDTLFDGDQEVWCLPQHMNIYRGAFPAVRVTDKRQGFTRLTGWLGHVPASQEAMDYSSYHGMVLQLNGDDLVELKDDNRGYSQFLLANGDIVSQWGPTVAEFKECDLNGPLTEFSHRDNWLCHNGKTVDDRLLELLAVTPDTEHVFYNRLPSCPDSGSFTYWGVRKSTDFPDETRSCALWVYEPLTGKQWQLSDTPGWSLRVSRDSRRYGTLDVSCEREPVPEDWVNLIDLYGPGGDRGLVRINGAAVFDLQGNVLRQFSLQHPVETRAWDWDIDAEVLAYYDDYEDRIVVQRLSGQVISVLDP